MTSTYMVHIETTTLDDAEYILDHLQTQNPVENCEIEELENE